MILYRRIFREFRVHWVRWSSLVLLTAVGLAMVGALSGAAFSVVTVTDEYARTSRVEDGQFTVAAPLTDAIVSDIEKEGYELESSFYGDYASESGSTLRVFSSRNQINLAAVDDGSLPANSDEVFIEKLYADKMELSTGDKIRIGSSTYDVSGIGSLPDYEAVFRSIGDIGTDPMKFSVAVMTDSGYEKLVQTGTSTGSETCLYAFSCIDNASPEELKKYLRERSEEGVFLLSFLSAEDNPRIGAAGEDIVITGISGIVGGVIFLLLLGYVISVFMIQTIDQESSVIGSLVALGLRKGELIRYYIALPALIGFIGACVGTLAGYLLTPMQFAESCGYFSYPDPMVLIPPVWIAISLILPPSMCVLVNWIVIGRRLRVSPLSLLRGQREARMSRGPELHRMSFSMRFGIRHAIHEWRSAVSLLGALFLSLLLVMLAVDCFAAIENMIQDNREDTRFTEMTFLTRPLDTIPANAEEGYAEKLNKEAWGYEIDVTLLGIDPDNGFLPFDLPAGKNEVLISTSAMRKFNLSTGDRITLSEATGSKTRTFQITGVADYSAGSFLFMNIDVMRELYEREETYMNVLFSDEKIDLEPENIAYKVSRDDIIGYGDIFRQLMYGLLRLLAFTSTFILITVLYLMQKNVIDRSTYSIALTKTFGYSEREVRRLYLRFGFVVVAVGAVFLVPLSKVVVDRIFPILVSNVGVGMDTSVPFLTYPMIMLWIFLIYSAVYALLNGRLRKVRASEILKQRE